jgi:membrane protein implicated in regulation of membrane protease activity
MSRVFYSVTGVVSTLFLLFWAIFGMFMYVGYGAFGYGVDTSVAVWAIIFLLAGWVAFWSFRRALKPQRKESDDLSNACVSEKHIAAVIEPTTVQKTGDLEITDPGEKLAALLRKPKDTK